MGEILGNPNGFQSTKHTKGQILSQTFCLSQRMGNYVCMHMHSHRIQIKIHTALNKSGLDQQLGEFGMSHLDIIHTALNKSAVGRVWDVTFARIHMESCAHLSRTISLLSLKMLAYVCMHMHSHRTQIKIHTAINKSGLDQHLAHNPCYP